MVEPGGGRLIAWNRELQTAHRKLRAAWQIARDAVDGSDAEVDGGTVAVAGRDLQLYCTGFCAALTGHHVGEDGTLFPALAERHPHPRLRAALAKLEQDHRMMATLVSQFDDAVRAGATAEILIGHLDGLAAIMDSHFGYEERELLDVLATVDLDVEPTAALGPL